MNRQQRRALRAVERRHARASARATRRMELWLRACGYGPLLDSADRAVTPDDVQAIRAVVDRLNGATS